MLVNAIYTSCDLQNFIKAAAAAQVPEQMFKERKSDQNYSTLNRTPAVLVITI